MNQEFINNIKALYESGKREEAKVLFITNHQEKFKINKAAYKKIIQFTSIWINEEPTIEAYYIRGLSYYEISEYEKSIYDYDEIIVLNPNLEAVYNIRGNSFFLLGNYKSAIVNYNKTIEINPNFKAAYFNKGLIFNKQKKYKNAINEFNKAINISPSYASAYGNRGLSYYRIKDYQNAVSDYKTSINLDSTNPTTYYNRGLLYKQIEKYNEAVTDFNKHLELGDTNYWIEKSQNQIKELHELIKYAPLKKLENEIENIKEILLFEEHEITHYTGLTTSEILISNEDSLFRLSESNFLNDTSEGQRIYKYLTPYKPHNSSIDSIEFVRKPFIGSFVPADKSNDLTLWRMYAKENQQEAKGCSLTFNRKEFIENIKSTVINGDKESSLNENNFKFYRVAYLKKDHKCLIPGTTGKLKKLNLALETLKSNIEKIHKNSDHELHFLMRERLSKIEYLFKGDEYSYESEIRLVMDGIGITKKWPELGELPKVYIEIAPIQPSLKSITIGPKVDRAEEWGALFNYKLNPDNEKKVDIQISQLPFK